MDDIATLLGTSKPTLYQHFGTKQKLLYACQDLAMDYGEHALKLAQQTDGSGWEQIQLFCSTYMRRIMDDFGACAVLTDVNALSDEDRAAAIERRRRISRALTELVRRGISDGSLGELNEKLATLFVLGAVNYILVWYRPQGEFAREDIIDGFIAFLENGLKGRAAT